MRLSGEEMGTVMASETGAVGEGEVEVEVASKGWGLMSELG